MLEKAEDTAEKQDKIKTTETDHAESKEKEVGGPPGPEPTRYNDWEIGGKCVDF